MKKNDIYKEVFGTEFKGSEIDKYIEFVFDNRFELTMKDNLNMIEATIILEDGVVYSYDGETQICFVRDLDKFGSFEEQNVCMHCNGEGYTLNGPECSRPASECCGGCYYKVECECELNYPYCD